MGATAMSASRIAATALPPVLDSDTAEPSRIRRLPAASLGRIAGEIRSPQSAAHRAARALLEENDGEIAAILCHEYRHSRQNAAKLVRCVLSFVLTADGDPSILENDAELYEHEARQAIFRR